MKLRVDFLLELSITIVKGVKLNLPKMKKIFSLEGFETKDDKERKYFIIKKWSEFSMTNGISHSNSKEVLNEILEFFKVLDRYFIKRSESKKTMKF